MQQERQRVCMPNSLYCFMYYLFLSTEEQIDNTIYFFTKDIPEEIQQHMPHHHFVDTLKWGRNRYFTSLYWMVFRNIKYPELKHADIYGLDFNWWLLRGLKMSYIEDGPCVLDIWEKGTTYSSYKAFMNRGFLKKTLSSLFFGEYYCRPLGTSPLTTTIYTSAPYNKPYHQGKQNVVMRLDDAWNNASSCKKKRILEIFNIDDDCMRQLNSRSVIILTQPYAADRHMTEEEQVNIYRKMVETYGEGNVIIKPHPRDKTDYKHLFPNVTVFDKIIPMQFLVLLGANFERVATINSSSALSFGKDATIDWWAEKMDRDVVKDEGFLTLEDAKNGIAKL